MTHMQEDEQTRMNHHQSTLPPNILPRLPIPWYDRDPDSVATDPTAQEFYADCEAGLEDKVRTFLQVHQPSQAIRQYGLQLAAFANQPATVRCLIQARTILHEDVFDRSIAMPNSDYQDRKLIYKHQPQKDILPLLRILIDAGWHPNQIISDILRPRFALSDVIYTNNNALVEFLLTHGANPSLGTDDHMNAFNILRLTTTSGEMFNMAIKEMNIDTLRIFIAHGVNPSLSRHLINLVVEKSDESSFAGSRRQTTAEYLLTLDGVDINDIKDIPFISLLIDSPINATEETTALAEAVAAQDWGFVRWLLEQGADPDLLYGKARKERLIGGMSKSTLADIEPLEGLIIEVREQLDKGTGSSNSM